MKLRDDDENFFKDYSWSVLGEQNQHLRFELFEWLKAKNLTANQAMSLLSITSKEIDIACRKEYL